MLQHQPKDHLHCTSSSPFLQATLPSHQDRCCVMRYMCHSSPRNITTSWWRQLQSGCCSGGLSPKLRSPIGALPLPHPDRYLNHCNKPLGTSRHAAPFLIATEGHPGKGRCILLTDTQQCTGPTQLLNDWGGGGVWGVWKKQSAGVGCHSACSSIFQSCAVHRCPSPPLSLQCPSLLKSFQTGLLLQCIKERVTCQQTTKCSLLSASPPSTQGTRADTG